MSEAQNSAARQKRLLAYMDDLYRKLSFLPFEKRETFQVEGPSIDALYDLPTAQKSAEALASRMMLYLGLPMTSPVVSLKNMDTGTHFEKAGMFYGDINRCHIDIYKRPFYRAKQIEAIMAHECTHYFLAYHHISLSDPEENELLTDTAAVYLGFGQLLNDGYATIQLPNNSTHTIGYITPSEIEVLQRKRSALSGQSYQDFKQTPPKQETPFRAKKEEPQRSPQKKHKQWHTTPAQFTAAALIVILSVACGYSVFSLKKTSDSLTAAQVQIKMLQSDLDMQKASTESYRNTVSSLRVELSDQKSELEFWQSYAVIVTTTGEKYHTFGCPHIGDNPFNIYSVDAARLKGYTPCLDCRPPTSPILTGHGSDSGLIPAETAMAMLRGEHIDGETRESK